MSNSPKLKVINGHVYTDTLQIAKYFNRSHWIVMRSIRETLPHCPEEFIRNNFVTYKAKNSQGKEIDCYQLTKSGFAMTALGFTGKKAIEFRVAYITRFDEMEAELQRRQFKSTEEKQLDLFPDFREQILHDEKPSFTVSFAYSQMILQGLHIPPISRNQIITLIKKGTIEGFKANRQWHVYQLSFNAWLKLRKQYS